MVVFRFFVPLSVILSVAGRFIFTLRGLFFFSLWDAESSELCEAGPKLLFTYSQYL